MPKSALTVCLSAFFLALRNSFLVGFRAFADIAAAVAAPSTTPGMMMPIVSNAQDGNAEVKAQSDGNCKRIA